jgi:hypothetical protein
VMATVLSTPRSGTEAGAGVGGTQEGDDGSAVVGEGDAAPIALGEGVQTLIWCAWSGAGPSTRLWRYSVKALCITEPGARFASEALTRSISRCLSDGSVIGDSKFSDDRGFVVEGSCLDRSEHPYMLGFPGPFDVVKGYQEVLPDAQQAWYEAIPEADPTKLEAKLARRGSPNDGSGGGRSGAERTGSPVLDGSAHGTGAGQRSGAAVAARSPIQWLDQGKVDACCNISSFAAAKQIPPTTTHRARAGWTCWRR